MEISNKPLGFVLAAGFGSRLGKLGKSFPKCLLKIGRKTLLELTVERLMKAGVEEIAINLHHLHRSVREFCEMLSYPVKWHFSMEESELLGTGGALKQAENIIKRHNYFILHNGDVLTDLNLELLINRFKETGSLAVLFTRSPFEPRVLLFNSEGKLIGFRNRVTGKEKIVSHGKGGEVIEYGFCGISIISSQIADYFSEFGHRFSLIELFLTASERGARIIPCSNDDCRWYDVGTVERLQMAQEAFLKR